MSHESVLKSYKIKVETLKDLLNHAFRNQYHVNDSQLENVKKAECIQSRVLELFARDYTVHVLDNSDGELGINYPAQMALLSAPGRDDISSAHNDNNNNSDSDAADDGAEGGSAACAEEEGARVAADVTGLRRLAMVARMGRCRGRFPIGVILYRGRHVCRSATLSVGAEMYPRHYYFSMFGASESSRLHKQCDSTALPSDVDSVNYHCAASTSTDWDAAEATRDAPAEPVDPDTVDLTAVNDNSSSQQLFDKIRSMDVRLLRSFGVDSIADLMVETKKVKFGLYVASSEKVDKLARYGQFQLLNMPYPGCEFFHRYCANSYCTSDLQFDWRQKYINAELSLPPAITGALSCDFTQYRSWHTAQLTANYLKVLLTSLHAPRAGCTCDSVAATGSSGAGGGGGGCGVCGGGAGGGILIHCISGWDRTPLFVSLLRLSLWADGLIHCSLDPSEVLYLTLAYDWFLFGHNLPDRITRDEEIMHFTFNFLKHIESDEFAAASFIDDHCTLDNAVCTTRPVNGADTLGTRYNSVSSSEEYHHTNGCHRWDGEAAAAAAAATTSVYDSDITVLSSSSSCSSVPLPPPPCTPSASCCDGRDGGDGGAESEDESSRLAVLLERDPDPSAGCRQINCELDSLSARSSASSSLSVCSSVDDASESVSTHASHCCVGAPLEPLGSDCWPFVGHDSTTASRRPPATDQLATMEDSFCQLDLTESLISPPAGVTTAAGAVTAAVAGQTVLSTVSPLAARRRVHRHSQHRAARHSSTSLESLPEQRSLCCSDVATAGESRRCGACCSQCVGACQCTVTVSPSAAAHPHHLQQLQQQQLQSPRPVQTPTTTSPLHVPGASTTAAAAARNRHESSGSIDSWQIVSESGSVPGSLSNDSFAHSPLDCALFPVHSTQASGMSAVAAEFIESTTTLTGADSAEEETETAPTSRCARLQAVRSLFLTVYAASVGLKTGPHSSRAPVADTNGAGASADGGAARGQCGSRVGSSSGPGDGGPSSSSTSAATRFRLLPAVVSTLAGRVGIM